MFAAERLQSLLYVSAVTSLLDTFTVGLNTYPMLMYGTVMPDEWGPQASTINYYQADSISGDLEYGAYTYYVNCRAATESESRLIAIAVFGQLNRLVKSNLSAVCSLLKPIPPADETDNFNTIVKVDIRTRGTVN